MSTAIDSAAIEDLPAMSNDDVSVGEEKAFSWKVYSVSARDKEPLLQFIREALEFRGCTIQL